MPNWVLNKVYFTGKEKDIERLKKFVESEESSFDFHNIIPMPEELNLVSGSDEHVAINTAITRRIGAKDFSPEEKDWVRDRMSFNEWADLGEKYLFNKEKYGATTWYDWCCNNWGTKWNASEPTWHGNMVSFSTAWSTPYPIFCKLAELFPMIDIDIDYADEDLGNNCGQIDFRNGECAANEIQDFDFACDIWGYDAEELRAEYEGLEEHEGV